MTENLGERLTEQLDAAAPPLAIDAEILAAVGRKRVRARRAALGGGLTAGLAAIVAAAVVLPAAFGGGGGSVPADVPSNAADGTTEEPAEEQPSHPLPSIDPDKFYVWYPQDAGTSTAESELLTEALWQYLAGRNLDLRRSGEPGDEYVPVTRENFPEFARQINELNEMVQEGDGFRAVPLGHTQPVYQYDPSLILQYSEEYSEWLGIKVSPKDGYLSGPGQPERGSGDQQYVPHLYAGCEDLRYDAQGTGGWKTDFTCTETTTSSGEQVAISEVLGINPSGTGFSRSVTVVVYRADGSALTLADTMSLHDTHIPVADDYLEKKKFALDADALIALAEALPNVIVK